MLNNRQAQDLLTTYVKNPVIVNHCRGVAQVAQSLANQICRQHPHLPVDPVAATRAALLHDIGKADLGFHEFNSVAILSREGETDLAPLTMHGFIYEMFQWLGVDGSAFLPQSLTHKIVVLADMYYNQNQQRVNMDDRLQDILNRYGADWRVVEVVTLARGRMKKLEQEILSLF